jgi:D-alanyl-D-alanine carboxypeptidase
VLGLIIERVTHASLQKYAERTLFAPLGMHSTSFALGRLRGPHAHGYLPFVGPFLRAPGGLGDVDALNGSEYAAAASLVSTARDLERFFVALFSGKVIPRSLVALMQATRPDESGPDYQRYGAGLEGSRYQCGMAWGHGGVVYGYRAVVRASRNAHTVIVLLVNHDYDYASSWAGQSDERNRRRALLCWVTTPGPSSAARPTRCDPSAEGGTASLATST